MFNLYFKITRYSHHFELSCINPNGLSLIKEFYKPLIQWGFIKENRRYIRKPLKAFTTRLENQSKYRFHINHYESFKGFLLQKQVHESCYSEEVADNYKPHDANIVIRDGWNPLDYQIPIIDYAVSNEPTPRKLIEIQTGKGKTFAAMKALSILGKRVVMFLRSMYIDKWVEDVKKLTTIPEERVVVVQGSAQLMKLIDLAVCGELDYDFIIISNKTFQAWLSIYEKIGDYENSLLGYGCSPQDFLKVIGAGVRLIDEAHQDFHLNFKIDLYTHVERSISLSATLEGDDAFLNKMCKVAYPPNERYSGLAYDKYVNAYSWLYRFDKPKLIRTNEFGSKTYSHTAFEKSIIKNPELLDGYLDMILKCVRDTYSAERKPGDRLLVYCATIAMCTIVSDFLKGEFPNIMVNRYVENDTYDNLMNSDISVSTILSAGTGHDIAGLTTVIMTVAIASSQSNIQGFGRLRKIADKSLKFVYFVCCDIPKHLEYHEKKKKLLETRAISYCSINYHPLVGR